MISGLKISVIGGGIAGMAAALACAQRGATVTVYEQADALAEVGAGLQVGPNGVAVLEALGLRDAASLKVSAPEAVELCELITGANIARVPMGGAAVTRWGRPYWQFHRADLLELLVAAAKDAGVSIQLGQRITDPGGDIIIAADGVRSATRDHLVGGKVQFTGHVAWRGLVPLDTPSTQPTRVWMGAGRHIVTYPLRGGHLMNFVAVEERGEWAEEGWNIPADPDDLRRAFSGAAPEIRDVLAQVDSTFLWGLFGHPPLDSWVHGNTVLIGDAAHPMLPYLAQGAVMALEDAWVLADCLASDGVAGLAVFERLRKPRATRVQQAAARNANIYHMRGFAKLPLHLGMKTLSTAAPNMLQKQFDWLYGHDVTT